MVTSKANASRKFKRSCGMGSLTENVFMIERLKEIEIKFLVNFIFSRPKRDGIPNNNDSINNLARNWLFIQIPHEMSPPFTRSMKISLHFHQWISSQMVKRRKKTRRE